MEHIDVFLPVFAESETSIMDRIANCATELVHCCQVSVYFPGLFNYLLACNYIDRCSMLNQQFASYSEEVFI